MFNSDRMHEWDEVGAGLRLLIEQALREYRLRQLAFIQTTANPQLWRTRFR